MAKTPLALVESLKEDLRFTLSRIVAGPQKIDESYRIACAGHILNVTNGYLILVGMREKKGAFHLVRPAYDIHLKLAAIRQKPIVLYWLFLAETDQERRWMKASNPSGYDAASDRLFVSRIDAFEREYRRQYPNQFLSRLPGNRLSIKDLARYADMAPTYNTHYNVLSSVSQGALRSMRNEGSRIVDGNLMVSAALYEAVRALEIIGHPSPNQAELEAELQRVQRP